MNRIMVTPEPAPRGELQERFHHQLSELQDLALEMTALVDRAIERSVEALVSRDVALASVVIEEDELVNQAGYPIHDQCVTLLAP